jgi:hypothetical protein
MDMRVAEAPGHLVTLSARPLRIIVLAATILVLGLGLFREAFLLAFGEGTPVRDLRYFNLNGEHNLPAWFSSSLMLVASIVSFLLSRVEPLRNSGPTGWRSLS